MAAGVGAQHRRAGPTAIALLTCFVLLATSLALAAPAGTPRGGATAPSPAATSSAVPTAAPLPMATQEPGFNLNIRVSPSSICAEASPDCGAGTTVARVDLSAQAAGVTQYWPSVQVVFAVDTTFFNGDFHDQDDMGFDICDNRPPYVACEESNGIPVLVANAATIAASIQAQNPHTTVGFSMVDFASTLCDYGDCDGTVYHVDFGNFVPASDFSSAVQSTFQSEVLMGGYYCQDCDYWDNFLHSPEITALYGVMSGEGIAWSPSAHHVVILMGDTAPRDPNYKQNYCVSGWDGGIIGGNCYGSGCEPGYRFSVVTMPQCEGWITSQDGNPNDSIAAYAHHAPDCINSVGGSCTVSVIDLYSTATDPYSVGWPANDVNIGGGPGGPKVEQNVERVLLAGCDMAAATGGSWDGPAFWSCPDGAQGGLQYVDHGPYATPNLQNPTLLVAFRSASFGQVTATQVASGGNRPIFTFVPFGKIALDPSLNATAACLRNGENLRGCDTVPTERSLGGVEYLTWNWTTNATTNVMYNGDEWTAEFNVVATGPPYTSVPVDACTTIDCKAGGSGAFDGYYTAVTYVPASNTSLVAASFPLASLLVDALAPTLTPPPAAPPPVPPPPFGFPVIVPNPVGQPVPSLLPAVNSIGNLSLTATAAGLLSAAFAGVGIRSRSVAMKMASLSGVSRSQFEPSKSSGPPTFVREE